ncbi:hypothetical protein [Aurantimonas coralicida]|uniref:hypothetical protein n=1 Tax=Aurantimonas coralicida TaxID=182270 RepID=UPI001D1958B0|nr:hypothetical protein [Aurantimonas coralicida]MCC4296631.1 hypothetical protein [Aurantimonas coralicida]
MKYMISGYGTGSRTKTGQAESRSFRTMRGKIDVSEASIEFQPDGVVYKDRKVPAMKLKGTSRKVGRDADNNDVSLILHDISAEEAMEMSARFAEYAVFLQRQKSHEKVLVGEGTRFQKAVSAAGKAFADYQRRAGASAVLQGLLQSFDVSLTAASNALRMNETMKAIATKSETPFDDKGALWNANRAWNTRIMSLIQTVIATLEAGPQLSDADQGKPGLRIVDPQ